MLDALLRQVRRPTVRAASFAFRLNRSTRYGLDLLLWSRLLSSRRDPVPLDLPEALWRSKGVAFAPPSLTVAGTPDAVDHWREGFQGVHAGLFLNLNEPDVLAPVRYAHPAPAFQGVYLWDSAFIAQVWRPWDVGVAREVNEAVVLLRDGARLQHVVADFAQSAFTQPPLVAWSVWRLCAGRLGECETLAYLRRMYAPLAAYNGWLYRHRRLPNGLFFWAHPYESGVENAPRFSSRDEHTLADTRPLAAPDLCAYVVLQNEALAAMAAALDLGADAERFAAQADALRTRTDAHLWHEADGLYYDRDVRDGRFVRSKTVASLLPLWAGIPSEERAARLRAHALDPRAFNTPIPLPSVALDDPDFAKDMWRGPVWVNTAYAIIEGLARYGFHDAAADLAYRLAGGVYRTYARERRIFEYYDPERFDTAELSRKKGNRWKQVTLGGKPRPEFVGWSGLANTLVVDRLFGLAYEDGRRMLTPRFPAQAAGLGFTLALPQDKLTLTADVDADRSVRLTVRRAQGATTRTLAFGATMPLDTVPTEASGTES